MKTKIQILLILFFVVGTTALASSPPWTGDGIYTFDDTDDFFGESWITDTATVNITGGEFGALYCYLGSTVNMWSGSATSGIQAFDNSIVNLMGGSIQGSIHGYDEAEIFFWVDSCNIDFDTYIGFDARLTGIWYGDNGSFDILVGGGSYPHINIVPEPAMILLFANGMIFIRKRLNHKKKNIS